MLRFADNCILGLLLWIPVIDIAQDTTYTLTIKDHQFTPADLKVPTEALSLSVDGPWVLWSPYQSCTKVRK